MRKGDGFSTTKLREKGGSGKKTSKVPFWEDVGRKRDFWGKKGVPAASSGDLMTP